MASRSSALIVVEVKSLTVEDTMRVPVEIPTPEVEIESEEVGIAVPDALRQNFTVIVPVSIAS